MRVNNAIREKIDRTLNKSLNKKIDELYASRRATEEVIRAELNKVIAEANEKAQKVLEQYAPEGTEFTRYGHEHEFICDTAHYALPDDNELTRQVGKLRERKQEMALDLEIRCQLEKDADKFFQMLAEVEF